MKRLATPLALLSLTLASACAAMQPLAPAPAAPAAVTPTLRHTLSASRHCVVVRCDNDDTARRCATSCGGRWLHRCPGTNLHVIDIGSTQLGDALSRCRSVSGVDYAEGDAEVITAGGAVRAPGLALDAAPLARLHAEKAWAVTRGAGMKVAILDTGVDAAHPGLAGRIGATANFTVSSFDSMDDRHGHGTFLAGVVAGATGGPGGGGVAPDATLMIGKVLEDDGEGVTSAVTDGIVWAANQGADVILLGLVARKPTQALQDAVDFAWSQGAVVVAAAGNDGVPARTQPAANSHSLAVGAVDARGVRGPFSNWGAMWVDVGAPGVGVPGLMPTGATALGQSGQASMDGTSIAAAYVAGEAALVKASHPGFTNADVRARIEGSASRTSLFQFLQWGKGLVDVGRAVAP